MCIFNMKHMKCKSYGTVYGTPEAIRRAARNNDTVMVERMLSAGANPTPAVHSAVDGEHRQMLELLLKAGADPSPGIIPAHRDNNTELLTYLY